MSKAPISTLRQTFTSFDIGIELHKNPLWVKEITPEDIKDAFKLASFIEKTFESFCKKGTHLKFLEAYKAWRESNQRSLESEYDSDFFTNMSDHILGKFFKSSSSSEKKMDVAVRIYTSLYPKQRLEKFIEKLILRSASFEAIVNFALVNNCDLDALKYDQILQCLVQDFKANRSEKVVSFINESLSSFKVLNSLPVLIGILTLNQENEVTKLVMEMVANRMLDRSVLSKNFWLAMFKNINHNHLTVVCAKHPDFFKPFCNFLIYLCSLMEFKEGLWRSNPEICFCAEISYLEVENILRLFYEKGDESMRGFLIEKLDEASSYSDSLIFQQTKHIIAYTT